MSVKSAFLNNFNIILFLTLFELVLSLVLLGVSYAINSGKLKRISLRLLKEGSLTLIIFSSFAISFFAGIHWKYASP